MLSKSMMLNLVLQLAWHFDGQCTLFCSFTTRLEGYGPKPMGAGSYQKLDKARDGFFGRAPGGSPDDNLSLYFWFPEPLENKVLSF